jgi:LasA protease
LDFAGGDGQVAAARGGTAYRECSGRRVLIVHDGGWSTRYFHLTAVPASITELGSPIARGEFLGFQSSGGTSDTSNGLPCGSNGNAVHLHFTVYHNNAEVDLTGQNIGGWTVLGMGSPDDHVGHAAAFAPGRS